MQKYFSFNRDAFSDSQNILILIVALLVLLAPIAAPSAMQVNWGFNALYYLPPVLFYVWIALAVAVALLLLFAPREHFISSGTARYLWGDRKIIGRSIVLLGALAIFFLFRFDAHFFGNGYIRIANLAQKTKPVFRWFDYGGTIIPYMLYQLLTGLGAAKIAAAMWAYQIISILSGLVFIGFSFKISDSLFETDDDRLLSLMLMLFSGLVLMFFGMVENFPPFMALGILLIYWYIQLDRSKKSKYLYFIWIGTLVGLFLNFQFITFIPANLFLTFKQLIRRRSFSNFIGSLAAGIFILAAIIIFYVDAVGNIALSNRMLFFQGKLPDINYGIFGGHHLSDILNLLFMTIPVFAIFILIIARSFKYLKENRLYITLGFLTLAQMAYLFVIDPKEGMARNIPMFGLIMTGFIVMGIYTLIKGKELFRLNGNTVMTLAPLSLLIILPSFFVHLKPSTAEKYIENYLTYNETKTEAALYAFRDYYVTIGLDSTAIIKEKAINKAPGALEAQLVTDLYAHSRFDESFEYALRLVERYPYVARFRMLMGNLLKHYKRFDDAEKEFMTALELDPYNPELYHFLSELYRERRQNKKCFEILERAVEIDPGSPVILVDLAGHYFRIRKPNVVDSLTDVIISIDSLEPYAYMYKGLVAEQRGRKQAALDYFERFIEINDLLPEVPVIRKRINSIYLELRDTTSQK